MFRIAGSLVLLASMIAAQLSTAAESFAPPPDKLIVHEWGTFTSLQDENGKAIGGINVDDEPVPSFVHQPYPNGLGFQHGAQAVQAELSKGLPAGYPYVTMRLETPVMYFYPPKSPTQPLPVDVEVKFHGGWLTQFYPSAVADDPGANAFVVKSPTSSTVGRLAWKNLQVGTQAEGPKTEEPVWLTPRNVQAANVTSSDGESERYLFYRGVGNIDAPLSVAFQEGSVNLKIVVSPQFAGVVQPGHQETIQWLWLVEIQHNGDLSYIRGDPLHITGDSSTRPAIYYPNFNHIGTRDTLLREMHAALVEAGLFSDEATAMLQTWRNSYFNSPGLRLFFIVPQSWTDHYLPLTISQPAEITRVMMGRIELISHQQRGLLGQLSYAPIGDRSWIHQIRTPYSADAQKFFSGRSGFGDLGVPIPPEYQTYLDLGRFRNALVLYQQAHNPTPSLQKFIDIYQLRMFPMSPQTTSEQASAAQP